MAKLLEQIESGKTAEPRRTMLYGVEGIGKSTWGAQAPKPIFIQTEDGLGQVECDRFPLARTYGDVIAALSELYSEKHPYRTVVVDTLDWLEQIVWAEICKRRCVENIEDIGYAKGYVFALTQWREVLAGLDALRNERGMAVILIAHSKIERFENPETESYDRYTPRLHKHACALVSEWCDEVLFATRRIVTSTEDAGFGRKRTTASGLGHEAGGDRVIRTTARPAHVAKNGLGLPEARPLDWKAYAQYLPGQSSPAQPEQKGA